MPVRMAEIVVMPDGADARRPAGNVVPFVRPEATSGGAPPLGGIAADARPVLLPAARARWPMFFAASLALHAGVLAAFYREAPPLASVGEKAISVEIVLGTHAAAGLANTPTLSETPVDSAPAEGEGPDLVKPEIARSEVKVAEAVTPVEAEAAPAELMPEQAAPTPMQAVAEAKPVGHAEPQASAPAVEAKPAERQPAQHAAAATESETPAVSAAVPVLASTVPSVEAAAPLTPAEARVAETPPELKAVTPPPRQRRAAIKPPQKRRAASRPARKDKGEDRRTRQSRASAASTASSGIGRGRSDDISNYRGIVAARLARNKHFPPDARRAGHEGRAVVSFTISGGGSVTRVALVRRTGVASLDREAQAMVHRSSPFPPPPSRQSMRFTVPVSFDIR